MSLARTLTSARADTLAELVAESLPTLLEDEALAIIGHRFVTSAILGRIAQQPRLAAYYSVRLALVAHRQTPLAHAAKLVHYLYWFDLLNLSINVHVPAQVRRAIETQLLNRVGKLSLGEKIASARRCPHALVKVFLYDGHPKIFEGLLTNKRLREDDLVALASSTRATVDQLRMIAGDQKWSYRYPIRIALVLNPATPRAAAASQLRHLRRVDLVRIHANPATSVYLRRCIERLHPRTAARIE
jgi:hypothetical protein